MSHETPGSFQRILCWILAKRYPFPDEISNEWKKKMVREREIDGEREGWIKREREKEMNREGEREISLLNIFFFVTMDFLKYSDVCSQGDTKMGKVIYA